MNISCQNSAYVGRTHLSQDDTIHKLLQAEIDTTNSNLDITNFNLDTLQTNYEITSNYIDSSLTPLTYLINSEITPGTSFPLMPDLTHTYIYNSNILGDIRFWVKSTTDFPVQFPIGVPDYRVKIDVDGKLKLYYTYDSSINLTWGNGWIDVANMIIGAVADSANQGVELTVLEGQILAVNTILSNKIAALVTAIDAILAENACLMNTPAEAADLNGLMEIAETSITTKDAKSALSSAYTNLKQFSLTRNFNFLSLAARDIRGFLLNNPLTAFTVGAGGVAVGIAYGIIQNNLTTNYINQIMLKAISNNSNLTGTSELQEYASNVLMTSNIFDYLQLNYQLQESQGFINGNILTTQFIPEIHTSNIGIGLVSSNYELNVVGKINADYYYKSGVLMNGTQWINSTNNIYYDIGNIGIGTSSPNDKLDVIGNINTTELLIKGTNISNIIDSKILITSNNCISFTNDRSNILNTAITTTSNNNYNYIFDTSNLQYNSLDSTNTTVSNLRDNLYSFDELFTGTLNNSYCKKTTFLIQTNTLINYDSVNYYSYTIDLTKYLRYLQISDITKLLRFRITATLASSVAVFDYLTECQYSIMMSQSTSIGQTGGFHCRAFGFPEDLNLTKFAPYKFIKTNNIYQLTYISAVVGAKFLITIIDEF